MLCLAKYYSDGHVELREGKPDISFKIRYEGIESDVEVMPCSIQFELYQDKVDMIMTVYGAGIDLEKIGRDTTFDSTRYMDTQMI